MKNTIEINGYRAVIQYDPQTEMFRGKFIGLNGEADFYAKDMAGLHHEGATCLQAFLDKCQKDGLEPRKAYSGKFILRVPPKLHAEIAARAAANGKSLNQWVTDVLDQSVQADSSG